MLLFNKFLVKLISEKERKIETETEIETEIGIVIDTRTNPGTKSEIVIVLDLGLNHAIDVIESVGLDPDHALEIKTKIQNPE